METLIIIVISIIGSLFAILYFLSRRDIDNINNQLHEINNTNTSSKILNPTSNKRLGKLVLEINKSLEEKQRIEVEYKRMDMELRQAIANVSHDLRTPLTSIMGYIQLMDDDELSIEERNRYIEIVKNRTKSLQNLISSFYELSRLQSKEYKFDLKSLNLSNIICDLLASFYNDFLNKGIEPFIEIDENVSLVIADENAVRRIFSNLIQNALRYGNANVSVSIKQDENHVITTFSNDAENLKEEDVSHLFERFFTSDRTRSGENTGLGLAITKELVEQMGHEINLEFHNCNLSIIIKWKI